LMTVSTPTPLPTCRHHLVLRSCPSLGSRDAGNVARQQRLTRNLLHTQSTTMLRSESSRCTPKGWAVLRRKAQEAG
jgi:hypothetical protein